MIPSNGNGKTKENKSLGGRMMIYSNLKEEKVMIREMLIRNKL